MRKLILPSEQSLSSASVIYLFLLEHSYKPLSISTVWAKDLNEDVHVLFSDQVWGMFKLSYKNLNYQMIYWKLLHKVYLTQMKRFYMNLSYSPKCNLCSQEVLGKYLHFWGECPSLSPFWTQLPQDLSYLLCTEICLTPRNFFMNYFWDFTLSVQRRCLLLAALTAAKQLQVNRWNPPHIMDRRTWTVYFLDIILMELSTFRIRGFNVKTVNS